MSIWTPIIEPLKIDIPSIDPEKYEEDDKAK